MIKFVLVCLVFLCANTVYAQQNTFLFQEEHLGPDAGVYVKAVEYEGSVPDTVFVDRTTPALEVQARIEAGGEVALYWWVVSYKNLALLFKSNRIRERAHTVLDHYVHRPKSYRKLQAVECYIFIPEAGTDSSGKVGVVFEAEKGFVHRRGVSAKPFIGTMFQQ